jgi:hypothetical protein
MAAQAPALDQSAKAFIELAKGGNHSAAILKLRHEVVMEQALYACDQLPTETINSLLQNCAAGLDDRNRLVLELSRDIVMPQKPIFGGLGLDMDEARKYVLKKLAGNPKPRKPKTEYPTAAIENCFYPEYLGVTNRRDRVGYMAENHKDLGPHDEKQINFFSLGGCFNWNQADSGTSPSGTTCGLFVRACLFACGCRAMPKWHALSSYTLFNYIGVGGKGQSHEAFVKFDPNKLPKKGDVFLIGGGTMEYKGQKADNSHVGIVISVTGPKTWETVEGGQSGNHTRRKTRELVVTGNSAKFKDDSMNRSLLGWVDIDKFNWAF